MKTTSVQRYHVLVPLQDGPGDIFDSSMSCSFPKKYEDPRRCHINPEILKNFTSHISMCMDVHNIYSMTPEKLEFRVVFFFKCTDLGQDIETNARHCPSNPVEGLVIEEKFGRIPTLNVKPVFFSHSAT